MRSPAGVCKRRLDQVSLQSLHPRLPSALAPQPQTQNRKPIHVTALAPSRFPLHTQILDTQGQKFKPERPNRKTFLPSQSPWRRHQHKPSKSLARRRMPPVRIPTLSRNSNPPEIEVLTRFVCSRRARGGRQGPRQGERHPRQALRRRGPPGQALRAHPSPRCRQVRVRRHPRPRDGRWSRLAGLRRAPGRESSPIPRNLAKDHC